MSSPGGEYATSLLSVKNELDRIINESSTIRKGLVDTTAKGLGELGTQTTTAVSQIDTIRAQDSNALEDIKKAQRAVTASATTIINPGHASMMKVTNETLLMHQATEDAIAASEAAKGKVDEAGDSIREARGSVINNTDQLLLFIDLAGKVSQFIEEVSGIAAQADQPPPGW